MTVIAWDGKTLAADKRRSEGTMIRTTTKIYRVGEHLVGFSGDLSRCLSLLNWYKGGANVSNFPSAQSCEGYANLLVLRQNMVPLLYENVPTPIEIEDGTYSMGSGREFAAAAMHLGKSSIEAVQVAIDLDSSCGNGIDSLAFG